MTKIRDIFRYGKWGKSLAGVGRWGLLLQLRCAFRAPGGPKVWELQTGTVMPCQDPQDYGQLTNAIIRASLSESEELAIQRHYHNDPEQYAAEWHDYNEICENAKAQARMWLGIE